MQFRNGFSLRGKGDQKKIQSALPQQKYERERGPFLSPSPMQVLSKFVSRFLYQVGVQLNGFVILYLQHSLQLMIDIFSTLFSLVATINTIELSRHSISLPLCTVYHCTNMSDWMCSIIIELVLLGNSILNCTFLLYSLLVGS